MAGAGLAASATGCATPTAPGSRTSTSTPRGSQEASGSALPTTRRGRTLLAYFSRAGENYYYGDRIDLAIGNTAVVAGMVADLVDVDSYEIKAAVPYPEGYDATVQRNVREQEADARPAIAGRLPDVAQYDTLLLGSGVWNVRIPMIMRTFVETFDLSGKTVVPFVTYAVSGMGRTRDEYIDLCPGATIGDGLAVQGEQAGDAGPAVEDWLRRIGLLGG